MTKHAPLARALAAIDAGDRPAAEAEARALAAERDPRARAAGARLQYLLRCYEESLATLAGGPDALLRLRYSFLKRLRFEVEAGAQLEALLAAPDARLLEAAVLHHRAAGRPDLALAALDALGDDRAEWRWLRARCAAQAGDRDAVVALARSVPRGLDDDARDELVEALLDVGAFAEAAAHGGDPVRARLALWRGDAGEALALAADDVEVTVGACVLTDRLDEAAARLPPEGGSPTLDLLRGELAWKRGDVAEAARWVTRAKDRVPDYLAAKLLWVLVDGRLRPDARIDRFAYEGLLEGQLAALGVDAPLDDRGEIARDVLDAAAIQGLAILGGNRTPRPTRVVDGSLVRVEIPPSPRHRARRAQHRAPFIGLDAAIREVDAVLAALGPHPVAACYRVELDLWAGRYETAAAGFESILAARRGTVWGWIGLASARLGLGDAARALATIDEGVRAIGFRGATVPVTRGEALLALGRLDEAAEELRAATRAHPGRVAAWALRVLCHDAMGDGDARDRAFARLDREAPALTSDAARRAGCGGWWPRPASPAQQVEVARAALALMRGNRSSSCPIWLAPGTDVVRAHVPGRPATTTEWERDERAALARIAAGAAPSRPR